ncbi:MAG: Rrf2 family transcriptional regulator [Chitinophagales bacterium]
MMFSKSCEYAIKAVLHICQYTRNGGRLGIKEIAEEIESPEPFTAKVLQELARKGIISSAKGPGGGFYIDPKAKPIPMMKVVEAIDGMGAFEKCGLGLKECSEDHPCPIHKEFKSYSARLKNLLTYKTVQEMAKSLAEGRTYISNV